MSKTFKFILHKINKKEELGYVFVQHIQNRIKTYRSLRLPPIHPRYWDKSNQRVKKVKGIDYKRYNDTIETIQIELLNGDKNINGIESSKNKKSFLTYFESIVTDKLKTKHGTRLKYKSVLNKLKEYLKQNDQNDLFFSDMDLDFLDDLQIYFKSTGMDTNTVIHYLKIIRVIIRKSMKQRDYINVKDPFVNFTFEHKEKKTKETLSKEEIQLIKDKKIEDKKLERTRNLFLFQFFTGGMRVSDLTTLRYNNFSNGRIIYKMFKTHNEITIPISEIHIEILKRLVPINTSIENITFDDQPNYRDRFEEIKVLRSKKYGKRKGRPTPLITSPPINLIPFILDTPLFFSYGNHSFDDYIRVLRSMTYDELVEECENLISFVDREGKIGDHQNVYWDFNKEYERLKDKLDYYSNVVLDCIKGVMTKYLDTVINEIHELSTNKKTRKLFVFKMLKDNEFENVDEKNDFSLIEFSQYQRIHKSGVLYNRHLKELQEVLKLKKSLRTHLPRISFTNIMFRLDGVNSKDISRSLGHSSVSITDEYLKTGFNDGRGDEVQKKLGGQFT